MPPIFSHEERTMEVSNETIRLTQEHGTRVVTLSITESGITCTDATRLVWDFLVGCGYHRDSVRDAFETVVDENGIST
jgi:hypothetical protein